MVADVHQTYCDGYFPIYTNFRKKKVIASSELRAKSPVILNISHVLFLQFCWKKSFAESVRIAFKKEKCIV